MATATKEQSAALMALRNRSAQSPLHNTPVPTGASALLTAPDAQTSAAMAEIPATGQPALRGRVSGPVIVSFEDASEEAADTTQISLRLPRPHLRALRQWAAEQTMARSDARTVTAQQIILKLIEGAVRHRDGDRG